MERATRPTRGAGANVVATLAAAGESLRDRHFRIYWISNSLFFIGQGLVLLGAQWLMLTLTDSRLLLGAIAGIQGGVVFLAVGVTFFCVGLTTARPIFAKEVFMVGPVGLGWLGAAFGGGSLVGSLVVAALGGRLNLKGLIMLLSCLGWCIGKIVYSQSHWFPLNLGVEFAVGLVPPFWVTAAMTILQVRVPEHLRSRVVAVHFMILQISQINGLTMGLMMDRLGDRQALLLMGVIPASIIVIILVFAGKLVLLGSQRQPLVPYDQAASGEIPTPPPGRAT